VEHCVFAGKDHGQRFDDRAGGDGAGAVMLDNRGGMNAFANHG